MTIERTLAADATLDELVTGNCAEAEELMQDAFLTVWERWDRVGGMDDPVGYLYRTAMNLFRKRYRRAMLSVRRTVGLAPSNDDFSDSPNRTGRTQSASRTASQPRGVATMASFG